MPLIQDRQRFSCELAQKEEGRMARGDGNTEAKTNAEQRNETLNLIFQILANGKPLWGYHSLYLFSLAKSIFMENIIKNTSFFSCFSVNNQFHSN